METAVLLTVYEIYPGSGVRTAVLPAAYEVFQAMGWKRPFCPQLTKFFQGMGQDRQNGYTENTEQARRTTEENKNLREPL